MFLSLASEWRRPDPDLATGGECIMWVWGGGGVGAWAAPALSAICIFITLVLVQVSHNLLLTHKDTSTTSSCLYPDESTLTGAVAYSWGAKSCRPAIRDGKWRCLQMVMWTFHQECWLIFVSEGMTAYKPVDRYNEKWVCLLGQSRQGQKR